MLITSDTMPPLLDGNGSPVRNGILCVRENSDPESRPLDLEDAEGNPVPNPMHLLSTGEMPRASYIKKDGDSEPAVRAWCFVSDRDGIPVRAYPLQNEPSASPFVLPQNLTVRTLKAESIEANEMQVNGLNAGGITAQSIEAYSGKFDYLQASELEVEGSATFDKTTAMSLARIEWKESDNHAFSPENWWRNFMVGSYGTLKTVYSRKLNSITRITGIGSGNTDEVEYMTESDGGAASSKNIRARICGLTGTGGTSSNQHYYYLVCRVQ